MKRLALAIALGLAGVAGVAIPQSADARIVYVDDSDLVYRNGRPYLRTKMSCRTNRPSQTPTRQALTSLRLLRLPLSQNRRSRTKAPSIVR